MTLVIDGEARVLKLTLGALAELEEALGEDTLVALVERFEAGRFSSRDVLRRARNGFAHGDCLHDQAGGVWPATGRVSGFAMDVGRHGDAN